MLPEFFMLVSLLLVVQSSELSGSIKDLVAPQFRMLRSSSEIKTRAFGKTKMSKSGAFKFRALKTRTEALQLQPIPGGVYRWTAVSAVPRRLSRS